MPKMICDSSAIISLSSNCLNFILTSLVDELNFKFVISEAIAYESIEHPFQIHRFELNAYRINELIETDYVQIYKNSNKLKDETERMQGIANSLFAINGKKLEIIQKGETEALAIINLTDAEIFGIDERTTRMLIEAPNDLREYLEFKHQKKVEIDKDKLKQFLKTLSEVKVLRSSDLLALAYEKNVVPQDKKFLEAALYALKYAGCSVSEKEIKDYLEEIK